MINTKIERTSFEMAKEALLKDLLDTEITNTKNYLESHPKSNRIMVSFSKKKLHLGTDGRKVATKSLLNPKSTSINSNIVKNFLTTYVQKLNEEDLIHIEALQTTYKMHKTLKKWVLTNYLDLRTTYDNYDLKSLSLTNKEVAEYILATHDKDSDFLLDSEKCSIIISGYIEKRSKGSIEEIALLNKVSQSFFKRQQEGNSALLELLIRALNSNYTALNKTDIRLPINLLRDIIDIYDGATNETITEQKPLKITLVADKPKFVDDVVNAVLEQNDGFNCFGKKIERLERLGVSFDAVNVDSEIDEWLGLFNSKPLNKLSVINSDKNILSKLFNH